MSYFSQVQMKHKWLEFIDDKSNDINIFGGDDNSIMRVRCSFKFFVYGNLLTKIRIPSLSIFQENNFVLTKILSHHS